MNLSFSDAGNGPEVLWAGMFTLVAVIGSVLLALWSQRRDFDRRETEMKSAFEAQEQSQWSSWRRHIAERCMALISRVAEGSLEFEHGPEYFRIMHETTNLTPCSTLTVTKAATSWESGSTLESLPCTGWMSAARIRSRICTTSPQAPAVRS